MTPRDFSTGSIADLCRPVSAQEISAEHVKRNAAYSSQERTEGDQVGRLKQAQTAQGVKRTGGGWRKMSMVKLKGTAT